MVANRLKADARAYMEQHPGTSYQQALRAVTAAATASPDAAADTRRGTPPDFFEALNIGDIATHDFAAVWKANARNGEIRVPIGYRRNGDEVLPELTYLNLYDEARGGDGSHGAIAGRTGSGKSHFLRTILLALAATYGPDTVSFVLADFKGGATFRGLDRLPHTALSMCDPMDSRRVDQLMALIDREMSRREEFITTEKRCNDIVEYREQQQAHPSDSQWPPLPDLLVVLDEFGELFRQHPAYLESLTRIARAGRSLGIHLLVSDQQIDPVSLSSVSEHLTFRFSLAASTAAARMPAGPLLGKALQRSPSGRAPVELVGFDHEAGYPRDRATGSGPESATMASALIDTLAAMPQFRNMDWSGSRGQTLLLGPVGEDIDAMIGQDAVKRQLHNIIHAAAVALEKQRRGLSGPPCPDNVVLLGSSGVGKTHVARILARALHATGRVIRPEIAQVDRTRLLASVKGVFAAAQGRVLVVEDAHELTPKILDALFAEMAEHPDTPVVLTGDRHPMQHLLDRDPDLAARFVHRIEFEDYTPDQLWQRVEEISNGDGYRLDPAAQQQFLSIVEPLCADNSRDRFGHRPIDVLGNLRFARRVPDIARRYAEQRLCAVGDLSALGDDELMRLTVEDIVAAVRQLLGTYSEGIG